MNKTILFGMLAMMCMSQAALSESVTVGRTYSIVEPDALEQLTKRASEIDWDAELSFDKMSMSATNGYPVKRAQEDQTRTFQPIHTVESDIVSPDGMIIYPRGFTYNVLEFITLPYRVVVIDERDIEWVADKLEQSDMLILTSGDFKYSSEYLLRPTFILDEKTKRGLGILAVPSIIEQDGDSFVIKEYLVEDES